MAIDTSREQPRPRNPEPTRQSSIDHRRILSDIDLAQKVYHLLKVDSDIDVSQVEVEAFQGEITLRGRVAYREDKENLEEHAESVDGVRLVRNYLRSLSDLAARPAPARGRHEQRMLRNRLFSLSRF
jgi:hypothetical protein